MSSTRRKLRMDVAVTPTPRAGKRQCDVATAGDVDSPIWRDAKIQRSAPIPAPDAQANAEAKIDYLYRAVVTRFQAEDDNNDQLLNLINLLGNNYDILKQDMYANRHYIDQHQENLAQMMDKVGELDCVELANWRSGVENEINVNKVSTEEWLKKISGGIDSVGSFANMVSEHKNWAHTQIEEKFKELQEKLTQAEEHIQTYETEFKDTTKKYETEFKEIITTMARIDGDKCKLEGKIEAIYATAGTVRSGIERFEGKNTGTGGSGAGGDQPAGQGVAAASASGACGGHCNHVDDLLKAEREMRGTLDAANIRLMKLETKAVDGRTELDKVNEKIVDHEKALQHLMQNTDGWKQTIDQNIGARIAPPPGVGPEVGSNVNMWQAQSTMMSNPWGASAQPSTGAIPSGPWGNGLQANSMGTPGGPSGGIPWGNGSQANSMGTTAHPGPTSMYGHTIRSPLIDCMSGSIPQTSADAPSFNQGGCPFGIGQNANAQSQGWQGVSPLPGGPQGSHEGVRRMDEHTRVYEEKTARDHQGDGSPESGPAWMKWTRLYLIGNALDAEALLKMAETATGEITMHDVANLALPSSPVRLTTDPVILSSHIWRYLNQATVKSARAVFENLEVRNGLEAWRRLYRHIHKGSLLQKHTLGMKIQQPAAYLKEAGNIAVGIEKWEQDIRDYVSAGGVWPAQDAMVMNLCSALPATLRSNLIWRTNEFSSYMHFKHYVTEQAERIEHFNGKNAIMLMDDEDEEVFAMAQERLKEFPEIAEALAMSHGKGAGRGFRRGAGQQQASTTRTVNPRLPGARRDDAASKVRCINCGGNHRSNECPKPPVPKEKRPCWTCGKAGCIASKCKSKKALQSVDHEGGHGHGDEDEEMLMLGWQTVEKKRRTFPIPGENHLGDHIAKAMETDQMRRKPRKPGFGSGERSRASADEPAEAKPLVKICSNSFRALECQCDNHKEHNPDEIEDAIQDNDVNAKRKMEKTSKKEIDMKKTFDKNEPQEFHDSDTNCSFVQDLFVSNSMHDEHARCQQSDTNIFEYASDDALLPIEEDEVILEVTADTGAVDNVANPRDLPGFAIQESHGSKNGKHFVGAGAERIENQGEVKLSMKPVDGGGKLGATFQAADITRALMSITKVCDSAPGTTVTFDSKVGLVKRGGRDIAKFYRKGGLYVMKVKVKKPMETTDTKHVNFANDKNETRPASGFPRQGLKR